MSTFEADEAPRPTIPSPEQLRSLAGKIRAISAFQATRPLERVIPARVRTTLAACLDELARFRADPALLRERHLQDRVDALAILATSRRLPLAAVEGAVRRAEEAGSKTVTVAEIRRALARTELP